MLPYIQIPDIPLGPITLHPFGILVATAVLLGYWLARRRTKKVGLDDLVLTAAVNWGLLGGFAMAHIFEVLAYHPEDLRQDPLVILKFWAGLSSFGGFIGGALVAIVVLAIKRAAILRYIDALSWAFAPAWIFGRLGCTVAHDHPGRLTNFVLAVRYPDGPRFDLGLYEVPVAILITAVLWLLGRRERAPGTLVGTMAVLYGLARFGLDFLRATDLRYNDPRYFGLTPAQYGCLALVALGSVLLARAALHRPAPAATQPGESLGAA
ncbi:MAG TPA: prolipoprotein diacylglyceryl transferase family protein [Polyangia bacterium]|jgi:phosphatidylglycerol:prolipoprotein diacylglycerol transferase